MPKRPRSFIVATMSDGYSSSCSSSLAAGITSRATNARTVAIISSRSSGSVGISHSPRQDRHAGGPGRAVQLRVADLRIAGHLAIARLPAQLQHDLVDLPQTGRTDRLAVRDQPAVGVHGQRTVDLRRVVGVERLPV